jgi:ClpP class serine protease
MINPLSAKQLATILSDQWLIEVGYAQNMQELIPNILNGSYEATVNNDLPFRVNAQGNPTTNGEVLVVPINGPMMKYDNCGSPGTATMADAIRSAQTNPAIKSIVLSIDSPGGSVNGTEELARVVATSSKPVYSWVHGMMASAAYWVGSQAKQVIINGRTSMVGSIGTMAVLQKSNNDRNVVVFADRSTRKNRSSLKAQEGDTAEYVNEILNPLNDAFEAAVTRSRAGKIDLQKEDVLTGAVYIGNKAIKAGLADRIGSFKYAVKQSLQTATMNTDVKFAAVQAAANVPVLTQIEEGYVFSAEEMQSMDTALTTAAATQEQLTAAQQQLQDAQAQLQTANDQLAAAATEKENLQSQIDALKAQAPALQQTPKAGADDANAGTKTGWDKYATTADAEMQKRKAMLQ